MRVSDGSTPRFLQGPFEFEGNGLDKPSLIDESLRHVVPAGAVTQPVYFRGGNSTKQSGGAAMSVRSYPVSAVDGTIVFTRTDVKGPDTPGE
jgi:hypothetical protein